MIDDPEREKVLCLITNWLDIQKGDVVLDIGCGDGFFSKRIAVQIPNAKVVGCDIEIQKLVKGNVNVHIVICDAQHLPFRDNSINKIVMNEVLEHLPNSNLACDEISRVLAVRGRAYIATPNSYEHMLKLFRTLAQKVDKYEGHLKHFSMDELSEVFLSSGLKIFHHHYDGFFGLFLYYSLFYYIFKPIAERLSTTPRNLIESYFERGLFFKPFCDIGKYVLFILGKFDSIFKGWIKGMGIHLVVIKDI